MQNGCDQNLFGCRQITTTSRDPKSFSSIAGKTGAPQCIRSLISLTPLMASALNVKALERGGRSGSLTCIFRFLVCLNISTIAANLRSNTGV